MTDNDIIKALECCLCADTVMECHECTYIGENNCLNSMIADVLDLINRQKAEIEQWKEEANKYQNLWVSACTEAKSETVREFLERLKEKAVWDDKGDTKIVYEYDIDKTAKAMMEGNNAE